MRKKSFSGFVYIFFIVAILGGIYYVYSSKIFERNSPTISLPNHIFWNLKTPLKIKVEDESGIKRLKIFLSDGSKKITIVNQKFSTIEKVLNFKIEIPKGSILDKNSNYQLEIEITDNSKWNFFQGNKLLSFTNIIVDTKSPDVYVLNNSYKITKGGSAAVVFKASDKTLKNIYIQTNSGRKFQVVPFYKDGYYASIIAWPIKDKNFKAYIVANDMAGNEKKIDIRYYLQDKIYKTSEINLNDDFLNGKITDLLNEYAQNPDNYQGVEKFKFINETLRDKNENLIYQKTSNIKEAKIDNFFIKPFYPLKNGAAVASFGDHRIYKKDGVEVSQSWHLGLDLASVANAEIKTSNNAKVVFSENNGIYGLNLGIYHGFGIYTIYGHCSSILVNENDEIKDGDVIANTGYSGLAFGDHLHFGVLVQGVEVRPEEWMDKKWMNENIFQILENSKKLIDNKK
ncbi:M23 family metallopeptidase [Campylobacter sp. FMV-PI01]|uniref:M23 family metallopeptidase n=1 Tax=Campylobacter portucalensis TaxID=2608384 RepID=A0A6L5WHW7_9BACT|nr:M23 family metallopeptidase [Campylobacter portucalensis]MSN95837.1 M23 family metallopeptidase [Campylobacter portucalensis]